MTAGSPSLNRHVPRTEERARIDAALTMARGWAAISRRRNADPYVMASDLADGIDQIISILDAGDTQPSQDKAQDHPAKPQKETV